jgi:hypothetical protein
VLSSYRPLAWFWGGVAWVAVVGGSTLQLLGPPSHAPGMSSAPVPAVPSPVALPSGTAAPAGELAAIPPLPAIPTPAVVEAVAVPILPSILSQPNRERPRTLVRKAPIPARGRGRGDGEDANAGERSPPPDMEPAVPARREQAMGLDRTAGYIGVFETGADGTRTFRATP